MSDNSFTSNNSDLIRLLNTIKKFKSSTLSDASCQQQTKFWLRLFITYFLAIDCCTSDDLLFFVRKRLIKLTCTKKYQTLLEVFRKSSKRLPITDLDIDWEETLYINLIMQYFKYTLTCAICTRTSIQEFQILFKHCLQVYASPSTRSMDGKGEQETITYPNIFFTIDNYEELLCNLPLKSGDMVCVELVASDKDGNPLSVLFSGLIPYDTIHLIYESNYGLSRNKRLQKARCHLIRMKGARDCGISEMAIRKQESQLAKSTSSTCLSNFQKEEMEENFYPRRRMSDPSSDLEKKIKAWKSKSIKKSRSANHFANIEDNSLEEIIACDFKDEIEGCQDDKLWHLPGFNQAFYLWKENKRANCPCFEVFITYITLPFNFIIANVLSSKHKPILNF